MKDAGIWQDSASKLQYRAFTMADHDDKWKGDDGCIVTVPLRVEAEPGLTLSGVWSKEKFMQRFTLIKK